MSIIQETGLFEILKPIFSSITENNWWQGHGTVDLSSVTEEGNLMPGIKCCVATHISIALKLKTQKSENVEIYSYAEGEAYILSHLRQFYPKLNVSQMCALFHCAGTPKNPFSRFPWLLSPTKVLERMTYIETLPPFILDADLHVYYYTFREVIDWFRLERKNVNLCPINSGDDSYDLQSST